MDAQTITKDFSERYVVRSAIEIAFPSVYLSVTRLSCEINRGLFAESVYTT